MYDAFLEMESIIEYNEDVHIIDKNYLVNNLKFIQKIQV
jgi:hypothetical protein